MNEDLTKRQIRPLTRSEIEKVPHEPGIFILFDPDTPIHADLGISGGEDIWQAKEKYPQATRFLWHRVQVEIDALQVVDTAKRRYRLDPPEKGIGFAKLRAV
jgi:hypothetical protein